MKKILLLISCMLAVWGVCISANAAPGDEEAFTTAFLDGAGQRAIRRNGWMAYAFSNDTYYLESGDGTIYSWKPGDKAATVSYQLAAISRLTSEQLTKEHIEASKERATHLVPIDDELWALNLFSASEYMKIGKITEEGVAWEPLHFDISMIKDWTDLWHPFVENGKLYAHYDLSWQNDHDRSEMVILEFDLSNGQCKAIDTQHADFFAPYKPGYVLLLHGGMTASPSLSVMELATGEMERLPLEIPPQATAPQPATGGPWMEDINMRVPRIGGLAYDPASDSIYFYIPSVVWKSQAGGPFEPIATLPTNYIAMDAQAWILSDGRYGIQNGGEFYVRATK